MKPASDFHRTLNWAGIRIAHIQIMRDPPVFPSNCARNWEFLLSAPDQFWFLQKTYFEAVGKGSFFPGWQLQETLNVTSILSVNGPSFSFALFIRFHRTIHSFLCQISLVLTTRGKTRANQSEPDHKDGIEILTYNYDLELLLQKCSHFFLHCKCLNTPMTFSKYLGGITIYLTMKQ